MKLRLWRFAATKKFSHIAQPAADIIRIPAMPQESTIPPLADFLDDAAWRSLGEMFDLSIREAEVLRCVLSDEKEATIARRLRISPHTVHTHMERLHSKLGARTRVQLVLFVVSTFLNLASEPHSTLRPICGNRTAGRCPLCS